MQRCNFLRVGNRTCIVSYSHFRKLHLCTLVFLYMFFRRKITKLTALLFPPKWLDWNLIRHNFSNLARSPASLQTMIEKNKIMILCSISTLIFVLEGKGDAGPVTCTCASSGVQEVVVWTAFTSACHSEGPIFGPESVKKN